MESPKVSIIMGIYNVQKKQLCVAIDSIISQTLKNWEFIICDDGVTDEIRELLKLYRKRDSRIILIKNRRNLGLAYSLNHCLKYAKGNYIARMDADDISHQERLQKQCDFLDAHLQYSFVGTQAQIFDESGVYQTRYVEEKPEKASFLLRSPFMHPTIMVRKEAYIAVDGYRIAKETRRAEDYDLFMRLYAKGYQGYNLQENLFFYREDKNSYKKRKFKYRIDEMVVRYKGFRILGLGLKGYPYIIKPLFVGLLSSRIIRLLQKMEGIYR